MKLEINVFENNGIVTAHAHAAGDNFYENVTATAERVNGKAKVVTGSELFFYDENHTENDYVEMESEVCCNLKVLAITEVIRMVADDYCIPDEIKINKPRKEVVKKASNELSFDEEVPF